MKEIYKQANNYRIEKKELFEVVGIFSSPKHVLVTHEAQKKSEAKFLTN